MQAHIPSIMEIIGFGPRGWGLALLLATGVTFAVALSGFALGAVFGIVGATAKLSRRRWARLSADVYTTVLRGLPDLLIIYLFYFGGSVLLTSIARFFGSSQFLGLPAFLTGTLALGIVAGAYQTEVLRGAYLAVSAGQAEAAKSLGLSRWHTFRIVLAPQILRYALPGLGNIWQLVLKDSALISVTGLVELIRQAQIGAGSTREPFLFYIVAAGLYLVITSASSGAFRLAETRSYRGVPRR
ncbi:ABC transporter permease [Rhizobium mayense]|uniref:ABC transporter permease n=1 Tax=Rhizobium mayense TaxID=1312184 RepID=A0ABT7JP49_9HYPH|nr:ABC transporter permease [Rhizobium mayense]MDL2398107.1 ABC transporter permease [Rhizobium mayense]